MCVGQINIWTDELKRARDITVAFGWWQLRLRQSINSSPYKWSVFEVSMLSDLFCKQCGLVITSFKKAVAVQGDIRNDGGILL